MNPFPAEWRGQAVNHLTFWQFQELVARYSGALAFLQTQHQSASNLLLKSLNTALQTQYLPQGWSTSKWRTDSTRDDAIHQHCCGDIYPLAVTSRCNERHTFSTYSHTVYI